MILTYSNKEEITEKELFYFYKDIEKKINSFSLNFSHILGMWMDRINN